MTTPFLRYQGADDAPAVRRMPETEIRANTAPRTIGELMLRLEHFTQNEVAHRAQHPWAERFVMGYPLPEWQRPLVWDAAQKVRFITSLWLRVDVGSYLVNDVFEFEYVEGIDTEVFRKFSDILLDGQQRLSALEDYFLGRIAVPDKDGVPAYWNELAKVERRLFGNQSFNRSTVNCWDEAELRRIYDLRSFGGTPHTAEQRASVPS